MKVLLLQNMIYVPTWGGANKGNRMVMEGLARKNWISRVVAPAIGSHGLRTVDQFYAELVVRGIKVLLSSDEVCVFENSDVEVHAVIDPSKLHAYAAGQIETFDPDVTIVSSQDPGQRLLTAAVQAACGRPLVYFVQAAWDLPFGPEAIFESSANTTLLQRVASILVVSNFLKSYVSQWGHLESEVLPLPAYGPGPFPDHGNFETGFVTMINPSEIKGLSILAALVARFPETQFAAVPTWSTTQQNRRMLKRSSNLKLLEPADDIDEILSKTRLLLVPSLLPEAFGLIVVEAMLRGIPVLASNIGGLIESKLGVEYNLPVRPISGYKSEFDERNSPVPIVPCQDIGPWEAALRKLLTDREHYQEISKRSRQAALEFHAGVSIEGYELFFKKLIAVRAGKRPEKPHGNEKMTGPKFAVSFPAGLSAERRALLALRALKLRRKKDETSLKFATDGIPQLPRSAATNIFPLSFSQQRLWFADQFDAGNTAYNIAGVIQIRGCFNPSLLEQCLNEILRRHEVLRATFQIVDGQLMQAITARIVLKVPLFDLRFLSAAQKSQEGHRLAVEEAGCRFDLAEGPLVRVRLVRFGDEEHWVLFTMHHIVSDGWSMGILVNEFGQLYDAFSRTRPSPLKELSIQYPDYAVWQREWLQGERLEKQLGYWKMRLGGELADLDLPFDFQRPAIQSHDGARQVLKLPAQLEKDLRALGRREGATLFMVLLTGFKALLQRYAGQTEITVGTPIANRHRPEVENLIGFFVNTLVLRTDVSGDPSFLELLRRVKETTLGAYQHQDLPFERLVQELQPERAINQTPLFRVFFNMLNLGDQRLDLPGLQVETLGDKSLRSKFDLTLYVHEKPEELEFELVCNADLFGRESMGEVLEEFKLILLQAVRQPEGKVAHFTLRSERSQASLPDPKGKLEARWSEGVHEKFSRQAAKTPQNLAIVGERASWNYHELEQQSNRLAGYLVSRGLKKEGRVVIYAHRSAGLVWALLGVLKAGGSFVILDPGYPAGRLLECVRRARPQAWIQLQAAGKIAAGVEELRNRFQIRVTLPEDREDADKWLGNLPAENPGIKTNPDDEAYVAFTSGSTGQPKGIIGEHRPLAHFVDWQLHEFDLRETDRFSLLSGLSHDPLLRDIFVPLSRGASVYIPETAIYEPARLVRWMKEKRITITHLTPAMEKVLSYGSKAQKLQLECLRYAFFGGDVLSTAVLKDIRELAPQVKCINFYGATETPQAIAYYPVSGDEGALRTIPLGHGIEGVDLLVINGEGQLAGIRELGEICVRSPYLARGYLDTEVPGQERFLKNWFTQVATDRLYRTGDLGRYRVDGNVEFVGRVDRQIKLRGYRVEPGEIEIILGQHDRIQAAVVFAGEETGKEKRLNAYVVLKEGATSTEDEMRCHLRETLPDYMIPSAFVFLDRLPLTPNGKVDRKALPAPEPKPKVEGVPVTPRTQVEELMVGIWAEVLELEEVGIHNNFFNLGGHSLSAVQVISHVREKWGVELSLRSLFESPTVAGFSEQVEKACRSGEGLPVAPLMSRERIERMPLSFAQERLWFLDQLEPNSSIHNIAGAIRIEGSIQVEILERTFNEIIRRHEVLRTNFGSIDGRPIQIVQPVRPISLFIFNLEALLEQDKAEQVMRLAKDEAQLPFNLQQDLMVRFKLLRLDEAGHVMLFTLHHIASDGWSMGILIHEFAELYRAFCENRPSPLPELPVQYADFSIWQREWLRGKVLEEHLAYWKRELEGKPLGLELPKDRARVPGRRSALATHSITCSAALTGKLNQLSRREGATLFMTLLAAFNALLFWCNHQKEIIVGTFVANRNRSELDGLIGFFVNHLMLRGDLSGDPDFREMLTRARKAALGAFAHQDLPFQKLVAELHSDRSAKHGPLCQVMLALHNTNIPELKLPGLTLKPVENRWKTANVDLYLSISETKDGLNGVFEYDSELFDANTIELLEENYRKILEQAVEDPRRRLSEFELSARFIAKLKTIQFPRETQTLNVAATFTAELVKEPLQFWMDRLEFNAEIKLAPYNQLFQELLDPGSAYNRNTHGANIVLLRIEDLARHQVPDDDLNPRVLELARTLKSAMNHSQCSCIVGVCPASPDLHLSPRIREAEDLLILELRAIKGLFVIEPSDWNHNYSCSRYYDRHGDELGHVPYTAEFFVVIGTMLARRLNAIHSPPYKVVVLDCDQTLWTGNCAEDGCQGVGIDAGRRVLQEFMLCQQKSGKLLCVCSKNDESDVMEVFKSRSEMCLLPEHVAAWRVNWRPKSENLKSLADELGVGLDSFIFVDDNVLECAEVEANCPEVTTVRLPENLDEIEEFLRHLWIFDGLELTEEDRKRTHFHHENQRRDRFRNEAPSLEVFLAGLELRVTICEAETEQLPRIVQLMRRTNQFNTTGLRYSEVELGTLLKSKKLRCLAVSAKDRFGDYGLVGGMLFKEQASAIRLECLLLSCRALGKGIEHQMLATLGSLAYQRGLEFVEVGYRDTGKNQPALDFLRRLGELHCESSSGLCFSGLRAEDLSKLIYVPGGSPSPPTNGQRKSRLEARRTRSDVWRKMASELSRVETIQEAIRLRRGKLGLQPKPNREYVAPRTPTEEVLADIYSITLGADRVGIHDNFFEIGGHSLLATQVISRARDAFQINLPLEVMFTNAFTIAELAKVVTGYQMEQSTEKEIDRLLQDLAELSEDEVKARLQQKRALFNTQWET